MALLSELMERLSSSPIMQEALVGSWDETGRAEEMTATGPEAMCGVSFTVMEATEFKEGASGAKVTPLMGCTPL